MKTFARRFWLALAICLSCIYAHAHDDTSVKSTAGSSDPEARSNTGPVPAKIDAALQKRIKVSGSKLQRTAPVDAPKVKDDAAGTPISKPGDVTPPKTKPKQKGAVTPLAPASPRLDLSYIPPDTFAALVVHPRRFWEHPVFVRTRALLPPDTFAESAPLPSEPFNVKTSFIDANAGIRGMSQMLGIAPQDLDEVSLLLDKSLPLAAAKGFTEGTPRLGLILRNSASFDVDSAILALTANLSAVEVLDHDGVTLISDPNQRVAFAFVTDSMFLAGQVDFVRQMISARDSRVPNSALTRRLEALGNRLVVFAIDFQGIQENAKELTSLYQSVFGILGYSIESTKEAGLTFDLDDAELFRFEVTSYEAKQSKELFSRFDFAWRWVSESYRAERERIQMYDPTLAPLLPYVDQLILEIKLKNEGTTTSFSMPKLKNLDKLPEAIQAADAARRIRDEAMRKQLESEERLRQLNTAFQNYHKAYKTLPALNGPGDKRQLHPGLSWRVYLLPDLNEAALYMEFKLDEPWDSAHNKKLIPKMPKMFGNDAGGKTSMHVFTGKGAPFQNDEGIGLQEVRDDKHDTLLVVEAGDDVAEIWTKPGGLVLNPEDPLKCLGATKSFHAVMMDGSIRSFEDLMPFVFRNLVQHHDGQRVIIP